VVTKEHPDRDELIAYSLDALDPREATALEAHVPGCARCTREMEALIPAVGVLGESVEQLKPPAEMRKRVLTIVQEEAGARSSLPSSKRESARRHERGGLAALLLRPAAGLAVLAVAAAALGGYLAAGDGGGSGSPTVPVLPGAQSGIGGTLTVGETSSMLHLHGLEPLSGRQVYQVWVAHGSSVSPSSNFLPDGSGRAATAVDGHLSKGTRVMVTREPHAGEPAPTSPTLLSATVQ
jgi:hypothetical protein